MTKEKKKKKSLRLSLLQFASRILIKLFFRIKWLIIQDRNLLIVSKLKRNH
jgi:hypothetical protein